MCAFSKYTIARSCELFVAATDDDEDDEDENEDDEELLLLVSTITRSGAKESTVVNLSVVAISKSILRL